MSTTSERGWLLGFLGLLGIGVVAGVSASASAAPVPGGGGGSGPTTTIGTGSSLQQRPIPSLDALTDAQVAAYIATMQQELTPLGYADVVANGLLTDGPTVRAIGRWMSAAENVAAARAYGYGAGGTADTRALMMAIDDQARENLGAERAGDYRAPAGTSTSTGVARPRWLQMTRRR